VSAHVIKVPDLGEGIAEVELVGWHVKPGDAVAEDQVLADVMTDKATVEIPSPVAGHVLQLGGAVGDMLAVGAELIRIELPGEAPVAVAPPPAAVAAAIPAAASSPAAEPAPTAPPARTAAPAPSPPAVPPQAAAPALVAPATPRQRAIASPALRARAWELGVDLLAVSASGPGGRVLQGDLDAFVASRGQAARPLPPPLPSPLPPSMPPRQADPPGSPATHAEKIVGLRRKIAQKMQEAKRRIPHFTYVEEVDVGELEALRARLNEKWGVARGRLTLLAFLIRAVVLAAREVPQVNARFDDEAGVITRYDAVHVGIATQTGNGLMVPVLRDAQARDLWSNAAEVVRLSEAARNGKVVRDELVGSTITITSLGHLGGIMSTPVINHPEVAIVGVNRIAQRPAIHDGAVVSRPLMNLSSSFDHRVVDGAQAAAFVQLLRSHLEHPAMLFIE
jgi:2-oxoisovalerate dehydrogenase E2 component (dihydrolipoyl transacylase)